VLLKLCSKVWDSITVYLENTSLYMNASQHELVRGISCS
jgi:hypothetical protein